MSTVKLVKSIVITHLVVIVGAVLAFALLAGLTLLPNFHYDPIIKSAPLLVLIAVGLVGLTLLRPVYGEISAPRKLVLSLLRLGVVMFVVVFILRPTCVTTKTTRQSAVLLIMYDQSRSMTLPHQSRDKSRWNAQLETLRQNETLLRQLAQDLDVRVYAYDGQLYKSSFNKGRIEFAKTPAGDLTDIGTPLADAVDDVRGQRLAAAILLGDGAQTAFDPRVELWDAADEMADLEYPLYTVAFGSATAAEDARDVALENMQDQYTRFVKNELVVRATVRVRGYVNTQVPVQLLVEDASGEETLIKTVSVTAREDDQQMNIEIAYVPQDAGQYRLILRAADMPDEQVRKNNELSAFLTVLEGGLRVLYLEGNARYEQIWLRRSIDASLDIELDYQWFDQRLRDRWPIDLTDTFRDPQYDVFIIGDLDSRALHQEGENEQNLKALAEAVERGKGLIMLGGFHSFGPGRYQHTPLADVLPVRMGEKEAQDFDSRISTDLHTRNNERVRMLPASSHYLMYLAPGDENEDVWRSLPVLDGANKFDGVKPRARVLAEGQVFNKPGDRLVETSRKLPLLVAGEYGDGRVLAFAADSTWRWSMHGHRDQHKRFWRQIILWLAKRDELERSDVWIKLPQRRYNQGSRIMFTTGAKKASGDVIRDAVFRTSLVAPDGTRKSLPLSPRAEQQAGQIEKRQTLKPGTYTIEVAASERAGKEIGTARAKFIVFDHDRELANPAANPDALADLASATKGGRPVAPEELKSLLQEIQRRPPELKIEVPYKWQLGDTFFDALLFLMCPVLLLCGEWFLRKYWGLV